MRKIIAYNSWSSWFSDAALDNLRKVHEGLKDKTLPRNDALLPIQGTLNFVCTSMNSVLYLADHTLRAMSIHTLAQRDAFISKMDKHVFDTSRLELRAAPFNAETLFADEVQPALYKLESHKQANKPVNVHVSVHGDT